MCGQNFNFHGVAMYPFLASHGLSGRGNIYATVSTPPIILYPIQ